MTSTDTNFDKKDLALNSILKNFSKLYISNSVYTGKTDTLFDLDMIYEHFNIPEKIIKIQYNNRQKIIEKGIEKETDCKTFYNQITFSLADKTSIKLFNNGNFQISGVKSKEEARQKLYSITKGISSIKGTMSVHPEVVQNILVHNKKIVVKTKKGKYLCRNVYKNGFFIIEGDVCVIFDFDDRLFISERHVNKKKNLYNINCEKIGYVEYLMNRKSKNLCLKDTFFVKKNEQEYSIFNKYTMPVGSMIIHIEGEIIPHSKEENLINIEYLASSTERDPEIQTIQLANINCNLKYILEKEEFVDRDAICRVLSQKGIKYNYDPCKYPGIKIDHLDTKLTIFRTGSILFSGKADIIKTIEWISLLFEEYSFKKSIENTTNDDISVELSIWDII
jgi:TATA-box binding protein (TBP) (component of TFIID and TFIIIB)